jgi:transmembrane sensor
MISETSMKRAIRAWTQRHSGTWLEADETELQRWLAAESEHRDAYEKVRTAWALSGALKSAPSLQRRPQAETAAANSDSATRASLFKKTALAASVVILSVAVGIPLWHSGYRWWNGTQVQLATLKGQPQTFALDDGTTVILDADSQLTANIGSHRRHVSLIHGEALFNVKHDTSRPFEVVTGAGRIQDLGTRFDVEALESSTRVAVIEGRVGVLTASGQVMLIAGQAGGYDNTGALLPVKPFEDDAAGWSRGQRHFDHELLGDVLERVARYHAVKFVFTDSRLRNLRISGTFRIGDLPLILRTLAAALPIEPKYLNAEQIEIAAAAPH